MKLEKWLKLNTKSLNGKTIAITGSSGDLCKEICLIFAKLNANLILINRSLEKSEKQKQEITKLYPNIKIETLVCDLVNFKNVNQTTEIFNPDLSPEITKSLNNTQDILEDGSAILRGLRKALSKTFGGFRVFFGKTVDE